MSTNPFPTTPTVRISSTPATAAPSSPVHALTFSAGTGQYLLTGSQDRQIRLFNPSTTKLIQTYSAHGYEVLDLAVAEDNSRFVSGGGDKTVFLWDVATGVTLRRFAGHAGRVNAVAFGGTGDAVVVSGSFDGMVKVWDSRARGDRAMMSWGEARDAVSSVFVRGCEVLVGSVDGRVRVYDLVSGCVDTDVLGASVTSVMPTVASDSYLVSTLDSHVRLMDRSTGKCLQSFKGGGFRNESYRVRSTLAMGDSVAMSGSEDGSIVVWDVLSGKVLHTLQHAKQDDVGREGGQKQVVSAVAWNQMRKTWASAGGDGTVVVWGGDD
ncbi:WD40 repeat-like protein [Hortaea werneckii]|uniref:Uncharacterized protein n=1 Tax=Hortaea werneckii TaxID=91943 RepID=A0A3M7HDD8_HORWE|nr:WD40 repeat-like protein [Hortaea werneckii]KAI6850656.1 WD40 repeat-like protein [Hortaea werneckii]KAI6942249.1 WD40 repeat-like protein [Hortaea werneckii]KAI6947597.1 WD40 repeat-like protein [Hortaea werneckii]KAI6979702.1 WD40 repeat-like protein [Hortaea werneckii]